MGTNTGSDDDHQQVRTVAWFSAGAASAVATKLALNADPATVVAYIDPGSEHPDNQRFLTDVAAWLGNVRIERLGSEKYADTWQVWTERRYLNGPSGALCTTELKKRVRFGFEQPTDRQVFGYTIEEQHRADRFREQNPGIDLWCPLIDNELTKQDCLALIERAGLQLPITYRLGFSNANCMPCVKGGMGYFNHVRKHFPDKFTRLAELERSIGAACLHDGQGPVFLDELDPGRGNMATETSHDCSIMCAIVEPDLS